MKRTIINVFYTILAACGILAGSAHASKTLFTPTHLAILTRAQQEAYLKRAIESLESKLAAVHRAQASILTANRNAQLVPALTNLYSTQGWDRFAYTVREGGIAMDIAHLDKAKLKRMRGSHARTLTTREKIADLNKRLEDGANIELRGPDRKMIKKVKNLYRAYADYDQSLADITFMRKSLRTAPIVTTRNLWQVRSNKMIRRAHAGRS